MTTATDEPDDFTKAMLWQHPEFIPVRTSLLPSTWIKYREKLDEIVARHPVTFAHQPEQRDYDQVIPPTYTEGEHVDAWGCVWSNIKRGREAIVTGHPLPSREDVHSFRAPEEDTGLPHGLMYLRLADLRGFEELMLDFAEDPPELQMLIDVVLEYNLRQVDIMLSSRKKQTLIYLGDDLGMLGLPAHRRTRPGDHPRPDRVRGECSQHPDRLESAGPPRRGVQGQGLRGRRSGPSEVPLLGTRGDRRPHP